MSLSRNEIREPTFLILTSLAGGEKHGYAIMQDIDEMVNGRVKIRGGTLYGTLYRLVGEGLATCTHSEIVEGRSRHYYALLQSGGELLEEEIVRMRQLANLARKRLSSLIVVGMKL